MANKYLPVSELEKHTGISNSTIRRYLGDFEDFFIVKGGSRVKKYEATAVEILQRIKSLYDNGMDTNEIHNILVNEFPLVMNGNEHDNKAETPTVPTLATSEEVEKIGEDIADIKKALEEQKQFIRALLQANQALLQKMDQDRGFFEQRFEELKYDRELVNSLRESLQQRKLEVATAKEEVVTTNEQIMNGEEQETVKPSEKIANDEEAVKASKQVTSSKEEATVKANEEVTKAEKEVAASKESAAPVLEEKTKRKNWLMRWLSGK